MISLQDFRKELQPRFAYMDEVIDALYYAIASEQHALLHGPGGHAKSTIVEEALKVIIGEDKFYSDVFLTNCAEDMDATPIMGYDDIPTYQKEGKLKKVLEDTVFLKSQYAILEEGLDAPSMLVNALKDPLIRGSVCVNGVCVKNKLKSLFICTNVDPVTWAGSDRSKLALLQRFTFSIEVKWPDYKYQNFEYFFKKRGINNPAVAKFSEICHVHKWPISPRSSERMEMVYRSYGITALKNFEGIPANVYQQLLDYEKNIPFIKEIVACEEELTVLAQLPPRDILIEGRSLAKRVRQIKGIPVDGGFSDKIRNILSLIEQYSKAADDTIAEEKAAMKAQLNSIRL